MFVIEKDLFFELEKGFGKKDYSRLVKKPIVDKNGHTRIVFVKMDLNKKDKQNNKHKTELNEAKKYKYPVFKTKETVVFKYGGNDILGQVVKQDSTNVYVNTKYGLMKTPYKNIYRGTERDQKIAQENSKLGLFNPGEWTNRDFRNGEKGLQPNTTISEVYALAQKDHQSLVDNVHQVGKMIGLPENLIVTRPSLKKEKRTKEKLMEDYNDEMKKKGKSDIYDPKTDTFNASTLRDVDGATLAFSSMSDLYKALQHYNGAKEIIRIKNNFAPANSMGYSDINMNIRLPNGSVSEIQLNTVANIVAKETYGHALYEVTRTEAINKNPEYKELKETLMAAQKALYGRAAQFSKEENFPDINGKSPFGNMENGTFTHVKNDTYSQVVKPYVDKAKSMVEKAYQNKDIGAETYNHFNELIAIL